MLNEEKNKQTTSVEEKRLFSLAFKVSIIMLAKIKEKNKKGNTKKQAFFFMDKWADNQRLVKKAPNCQRPLPPQHRDLPLVWGC